MHNQMGKFTGERVIPEQDRSGEKYYGHLIFYDFAKKYVKGKIVLDDGCGTGYGSAFLLKAKPLKVIGIDVSVDAIIYAIQRYRCPQLSFLVADGCQLPFPDKSFDVVISSQVIEHVDDDEAYLREVVRILKDDGFFMVSTPNKQTFNPNESPMPFHCREYYVHEFVRLLQSFFRNVKIFGQYCTKKSGGKTVRDLLVRLGQSGFLSWIPLDFRVKRGRMIANIFSLNEKYSLKDFNIQKFNPLISMNIICLCSMKKSFWVKWHDAST
jgi:ubiquinone/menaquinone biosynthesis C-methylase UbiE